MKTTGKRTLSKGINASLGEIRGNPQFKAQFNLNIEVGFYQNGVGVISHAALPANAKVKLPFYIFGNIDQESDYIISKSLVPRQSIWSEPTFAILQSAPSANLLLTHPNLKRGDATITNNYNDGAVSINCYIRISSPQVAYGSLLAAISSDIMYLNMIRYIVESTKVHQLSNQLTIYKQTLLGKFSTDKIDPNTFVTGGTFNQNISDIPIDIILDKNIGICSYVDYDVEKINFVITAQEIKRLGK